MPNQVPSFGFFGMSFTSAVIAGIVLLGVVLIVLQMLTPASPRYKSKPLLSKWERRTMTALYQAVPSGWHICPQARIADFLDVEGGHGKDRFLARARIQQRSVDFLLVDAAAMPRLVVELDDRSHSRPDRRRRDHQNDAAYEQACLPVKHIYPGETPNWRAIVSEITSHAHATAPPVQGLCVWFSRGTMPETFGLDASVLVAGLTLVCTSAALVEIRNNADGSVHSLRLQGTNSALAAVATDLRERAGEHGVIAMIRPWPEWGAAWNSSAPT